MINSEYSPYKAVHHIDRLRQMCKEGCCVPVTIHLAPTTACNCRCYYCYVQDYNQKKVQLDKYVLFRFLQDAADMGVKAVEITGGGEPTMYPHFDELISFCHSLQLDLGIVSNGYYLNPDVLKYVKWLRISIDTFTQDLYAEIRGTSFPDLSCIRKLSEEYNVVTGASCVITRKNYGELYQFAEIAKMMGFKNVWFKGVEGSEEIFPFQERISSELEKTKPLSCDSFKVFIGDIFNRNNNRNKCFSRCMFQHMAMMVYADGDIYYCCSLQGQQKYAYANIYRHTLSEIIRMKKELPVADCPLNCFWENKNVLMEYLIDDNPKHINFM